MTDADLRALERAHTREEPGARDALIVALRRAGRDQDAWDVLVKDAEDRAARTEALLATTATEPYDAVAHIRMLDLAGQAADAARKLRVLDGRVHLVWEHGQRVQITKGVPEAKPPRDSNEQPRGAPPGTQGIVFYIAHPATFRGRHRDEPERKIMRGEVAASDEAWRIGMRIVDHESCNDWAVFHPSTLLERVVAHAWPRLDAESKQRDLAERGAFPERGSKVEGRRRDPKDGLMEVVLGRCCWAGVTKAGDARVGIERKGKPVAWFDLADVTIKGPPRQGGTRCMRL